MDVSSMWLFWISMMAINLVPGPDMVYIAANGVSRGTRAGLISALGVGFGAVFHAAFASVGISAFIASTEWAFDVLRIGGAVYLIWLGVKSFRNPPLQMTNMKVPTLSGRDLFLRGLVTNILNPKVALFFIAFLPQFISPESENVAGQIFLLGCLFGVNGTVINMLVGLFSGGAGRYLLKSNAGAIWVSRISGSLLIALGARLFFLEKN
jgi:threonine/homoserine/homoserine lactone efflux protein